MGIHMLLSESLAQLAQLAADRAASSVGLEARCGAANFRWEAAASDARATEYNTYVGAATEHRAWQAEHKGYLSSFVQVPKDSMPLS